MASQRPAVPGTSKSHSPPPPRRTAESNSSFINYVASYFKKAVVVLVVWAAGFYKFSPSWLLLGLVVYVWKERQQAMKQHSIAIAQEIARDEKGAILARIEDLPSWVYFPDVERAEWVNKIVDQLWPYIGEYVRELLKEVVEPKVKASLPPSMGSFKFSRIDLGDIPPRIGGVKVYTHQVRRDEIYLDLDINYASDSNLSVQVKGMNFGVRDLTEKDKKKWHCTLVTCSPRGEQPKFHAEEIFCDIEVYCQLRGTLRIIFRPLITRMPLIGGITLFFLNNPELDFNLTNLANAFDLPGLNDILRSIIEEQIAERLVLPNRLPIQIANNVDLRKLRYPLPQGVLRVQIIEARDLLPADSQLFGKGKSDPYAVVMVGAQTLQTTVISNSLAPQWNQTFEYVVDERKGQLLKITVMDKDKGSKDDNLGSTSMDISTVCQKGTVEEWLPLEEVSTGIVHLRASWLYLSSDPAKFTEVPHQVKKTTREDDMLHTALLVVYLDSAVNLPRGQRGLQEPSPQVLLTVGQVTHQSRVRAATTDPTWEQNFRFFVANPNHQSLEVEVCDSRSQKEIGGLRVYLKKLMAAQDMVMERQFPLRTSEQDSALCMTLVLRILTPDITPEWLESEMTPAQHVEEEETTSRKPKQPDLPHPSTQTMEDKEGSGEKREEEVKEGEGDEGEASSPATEGEEKEKGPVASPDSDPDIRRRKQTDATSPASKEEEERGEFGVGRVQVTLRYSAARQQLVVVIHRVVNLKALDKEGKKLPDPFVAMHLSGDRDSRTKRETAVSKHTLNPVFDTQLTYDVSASEVPKRRLEMAVRNETGLFSSSPKVLGTALIPLSSLDVREPITQWLDLAPEGSATPTTLTYGK